MMWTDKYLRYTWDKHSFNPPALHCAGLCLTILRERAGIEIPHEQVSAESLIPWVRELQAAEQSGHWLEVARMQDGVLQFNMPDKELDIVLLSEVVGSGYRARRMGLHCGLVVVSSLMIDISEQQGVKVRHYYDTPKKRAHPEPKHSVISVHRHRLLA